MGYGVYIEGFCLLEAPSEENQPEERDRETTISLGTWCHIGAWNPHTQQALVHFRVPGTGSLPMHKEANMTALDVTKRKGTAVYFLLHS